MYFEQIKIKIKQKTKIKERKVELFCFFDYDFKSYSTQDDFIDAIIKDVPKIIKVGYAGFSSKKELKKHLMKAVFGTGTVANITQSFLNEKKILQIAKNILQKGYEKLETENIYLFIFPNFNSFKQTKMNGVGGFCSSDNVILIDINPVIGWENAFQIALSHEFHHTAVAKIKSPKKWTLLESFVYEGMADNFVEDITETVSPWAKKLSKTESLNLFAKIKSFLDVDDIDIYEQVFYKGEKYPMWGGYSIGYQMVKSYLQKNPKYDWNDLIKKNQVEILKKSFFRVDKDDKIWLD